MFTWNHKNMVGIDTKIIEYHLYVDPKAKKIKQKRRNFSAVKYAVIVEEMDRKLEVELH